MRQVGEPTVEEILESIKKVIARDNRTGAVEERRVRETAGVSASEADEDGEVEVLDLAGAEFAEDEAFDSEDDSQGEPEAPLLAESVQANMRESLAALAMLSEPGAQPQIVRSGETSLEGMVRELLRPALAEWLDKNLPPLVERMVAAEISRIVGKRG
ncbi:MAG: DUF2497 domain-containing protein [Novosphingobium sp.]|nr:DUF2497 domain-containing protein [Novosphingobium sp.]